MRTAADGEAFERTLVTGGDPLVGTVLDRRFRIDCQLAAGGFGAIYRATDVLSDAEVALKVLLPRLARDPMVVARFRREGQTLASLRDPHTITAYELGEAPDGTLYIVMELLHGESLYTRFRREGPLPWRRVLHIAAGVCSSLAEAHGLGVVHRDLKPANIHLENRNGDGDFVKVLDFGIAKIVQGSGPEHTELTQAGQMIGTVDYMSPEQMVGGELTPASDIYTLGVVMYEMIAGRTPFADAQSATAILAAVLTRNAELLSTYAPVPPVLDDILARCLARDAAERYRDVSDLADALADVAAGRSGPRVPSREFDEPGLTTDATRIDVRATGSSDPVLDARGARRRLPERPTPPGAGTPPPRAAGAHHAVGSRHAIDVRGAARGSTPDLELPTMPAPGRRAHTTPGPRRPPNHCAGRMSRRPHPRRPNRCAAPASRRRRPSQLRRRAARR
jgi:serine/threonine protein kinase